MPRGASVLCSIDANLRVRSSEEPWVGSSVDPPGKSGVDEKFLLRLARILHSSIDNTHEHNLYAEPSTGTFVPNRGSAVRSDYFLSSFDVQVIPNSCWVDEKFLKHAACDDHLPLRMSLVFPVVARVPLQKRKVLPYSRSDIHKDCEGGHLQICARRLRVAERLSDLSLAPVAVEGTSHAYIYHQSVVSILSDEYPNNFRQPKES